jgi:hypothetical protein
VCVDHDREFAAAVSDTGPGEVAEEEARDDAEEVPYIDQIDAPLEEEQRAALLGDFGADDGAPGHGAPPVPCAPAAGPQLHESGPDALPPSDDAAHEHEAGESLHWLSVSHAWIGLLGAGAGRYRQFSKPVFPTNPKSCLVADLAGSLLATAERFNVSDNAMTQLVRDLNDGLRSAPSVHLLPAYETMKAWLSSSATAAAGGTHPLAFEKIDICCNGCIAYADIQYVPGYRYRDLQSCPTCGTGRGDKGDSNTATVGRLSPCPRVADGVTDEHLQFFYRFSLKTQLLALLRRGDTSPHMAWNGVRDAPDGGGNARARVITLIRGHDQTSTHLLAFDRSLWTQDSLTIHTTLRSQSLVTACHRSGLFVPNRQCLTVWTRRNLPFSLTIGMAQVLSTYSCRCKTIWHADSQLAEESGLQSAGRPGEHLPVVPLPGTAEAALIEAAVAVFGGRASHPGTRRL